MDKQTVLWPVPGRCSTRQPERAGWWHATDDHGRIICDLCPRECNLKPGDRGFCFVRENRDGQMILSTYGRSTGFCIDPIEKKPLNHFLPGTSVLSFGTAGCNLGCQFCQNWDISKSREVERLSTSASPEDIARAAQELGCGSVAFTYNDPVIWAEYAIETAVACRQQGVRSVAVTAGYISPQARAPFFGVMDAVNIDLKSFSEEFYSHITYAHLQPVLDTIAWVIRETDVWVEITNLLIPDANDSPDEIRSLCDWMLEHIGDDVPIHFTAFHPDFRMRDRPRTPPETLLAAYDIAKSQGLRHVYVGNVDDQRHQSTYCPDCQQLLIERNWYELGSYHLDGHHCGHCGTVISGRFADVPGHWGRQRRPIDISAYRSDRKSADVKHSPVNHSPVNSQQPMTESSQPLGVAFAGRPQFSDDQQTALHRLACHTISARAAGNPRPDPPPQLDDLKSLSVQGAFVTAKMQGKLRACCGTFGPRITVCDALLQAAWRTAGDDPRFPPIASLELSQLTIDITLLIGFRVLSSTGLQRIADVEIGRHGLLIQQGKHQGLLLPSVAVEHGLDAEQFLELVCRKAGLEQTVWKQTDAKLSTFEGILWGGPFAGLAPPSTATPIAPSMLDAFVQHAQNNLEAVATGATPNPYATQLVDRSVSGLILSVGPTDQPGRRQFGELRLRSGLPLQSTLFQLVQSAAAAPPAISPSDQSSAAAGAELDLCILTDATLHGTRDDADLAGVNSEQRGLGLHNTDNWTVLFDPERTPAELLDSLRDATHGQSTADDPIFSVAVSSTSPRVLFHNAPQPAVARDSRRPAVAGQFYPADAQALTQLVGKLMSDTQTDNRGPWPALMLPHAGLRYSGALAAATLQRVQIPETVIIIGPKHTRRGANWAVAPHSSWELPGGELAADTGLAELLADRISGLEMDAAAHADEHAIEVELPLIAHLAPATRVVGIVIGRADLEACLRFAAELAQVLRSLPRQPLLVISSDMNHFADDATTRQLDGLALEALETRDPGHLLTTVRQRQISMCGVLPATIVLETLHRLGQLTVSERVGYATSGDVSGERDRVVGYAGMLFG